MSIKIKRLIRHELLNLFTIVDFATQASKATPEEKNKIISTLSEAILLVAHENLFLGKKPKLIKQEVGLQEIILSMIHSNQASQHKIKIDPPKNDLIVKIDQHYFNIALKELINWLTNYTNHLSIKIEPKTKTLIIETKKVELPVIKKTKLSEPLENREVELGLQLTLEVFNLLKIKWKADNKKIQLTFPAK